MAATVIFTYQGSRHVLGVGHDFRFRDFVNSGRVAGIVGHFIRKYHLGLEVREGRPGEPGATGHAAAIQDQHAPANKR